MTPEGGFIPERDILKKRFGGIDLILLTDAYIEIEGSSVFSPATKEQWSSRIGRGESGTYSIPVRSLLIEEEGIRTLVDTGFGEESEPDRELSLSLCLQTLDIAPESIDHVVITHLHEDHFLGNTVRCADGWRARFPHATYYAPEKDVKDLKTSDRSSWETRFQPIDREGNLTLLRGETTITRSVFALPTGGHTRGHMSVRIANEGNTALFLGDLGLHRLNLEMPQWGPDWAWSREIDIEDRRRIAESAVLNHELIIAGHDPEHPWFYLISEGSDFKALPA